MLLDELGYLLDQNDTGRTLGTDLFKGFQSPLAPATATFIYEYGGRDPSFLMGGSSTPAWENPRFQVANRSTDYQTARNRAEKHYKILMGQTGQILKPSSGATGVRYLSITPSQSPFSIGVDENDRHQIIFNCEASKPLST